MGKLRSGIACAALAASVVAASAANAQDTVSAVLQRHIDAYAHRDVAGLINDYGDDVVIVFDTRVISGKANVRTMFGQLWATPEGSAPFDVKVDHVEGDVGFTKWIAYPGTDKAVAGNDVFVVRGGKIRFQTTTNVHPAASK